MRGPETRDPGAYTYHYDRMERLSRGGVDRDRADGQQGGLFKRNRSLAIIVIDLLVILLIYGLYQLFFAPAGHIGEIAGHEVTLRAFSFDDELYVTLRAAGNGDAIESPMTVVFAAGDESAAAQELLPGADSERAYRAVLAVPASSRVTATLTVGGETETLQAVVDAE